LKNKPVKAWKNGFEKLGREDYNHPIETGGNWNV
jgi:hypothetical protein